MSIVKYRLSPFDGSVKTCWVERESKTRVWLYSSFHRQALVCARKEGEYFDTWDAAKAAREQRAEDRVRLAKRDLDEALAEQKAARDMTRKDIRA